MTNPEIARPERKTLADLYPTPEDWVALQGGEPRVFRNPKNAAARWIVLHVYDEHGDAKRRFQRGLIVETLPDRTREVSRLLIEGTNNEGINVRRDIAVPAFMVRANHGEVCDTRSSRAGSTDGYDRVNNQDEYELLIDRYRYQGMQELRYEISQDGNGAAMHIQPEIRLPRPLQQ